MTTHVRSSICTFPLIQGRCVCSHIGLAEDLELIGEFLVIGGGGRVQGNIDDVDRLVVTSHV